MSTLLLDTHILLWWYLDDTHITPTIARKITEAERTGGLGISAITLWEIAKLVQHERFQPEFSLDDWFAELEADPGVTIYPLSARAILESTRLGSKFHKDPADQIIVATARCYGIPLLTIDTQIRKSGLVSLA